MKILVVIANPLGWLNPHNYGGGEINTVTSLEEWDKQGIMVETIEPRSCSVSKATNKPYKMDLVSLLIKNNNIITTIINFPYWTIRVIIKGLRSDADIIYASTSNITDIFPAYFIAKIKNKPLISCVRVSVYDKSTVSIFKKIKEEGSGFLSATTRAIGAKIAVSMLRNCNRVLTPCKLIKRSLIELKVKKNKIVVLDHGIETKKILSVKNNRKDIELCYFSRVEKYKGIEDFLYLCQELSKTNKKIKAVVVGNGSEFDNVKKFVKDNNLENNVILPGFVLGNEKYKYIKRAKVAVYPTYAKEGWGIIVPETLCCSTPLISYDNPITKNVFGHLKSVFFVKTGDKSELLSVTKKILKLNNKKYTALKDICIEEGSSYDIKKIAKNEICIIKESLQNGI